MLGAAVGAAAGAADVAAGAAVAGVAAVGAAGLVGLVAAGAAGAGALRVGCTDLPPPIRLAWARCGASKAAMAKAATAAEERVDIFMEWWFVSVNNDRAIVQRKAIQTPAWAYGR